MERFLFIFGLIVFAFCFIFFVMNFVTEYEGLTLLWTVFGMLNACIAMGISEILSVVKGKA
ncbi:MULTISPECIES: hypothetical protein [Bacillaceae]|uniref:Uncharacterized protein n=1 Tax=Evansella alkalicola TaxID=745819 RepID=A0ABS6JUK5_9BACI|nr:MULTISPECIES: hypothetical protein [Bacillaceae]MBU9721379.1 hypothetical protein [Bacillus alkalicola]